MALWEAILFAGVLGVITFLATRDGATTKPDVEHVYDTRFGRVLCMTERREHCGVTLERCHDARVYLCLTDIRREME